MNRRSLTILLYILMFIGLSLLLYPNVSDWWNSFHQTLAIMNYTGTVSNLSNEVYEQIMSDAADYNARLSEELQDFKLTDEQWADYEAQLDPGGTGFMCTIDIPSINCTLPVYHGTDDSTLQKAVGHVEWSSLPVGGEGCHMVLSGHRGLPSARLFTDIDRMVEGDLFRINVLGETLTYEVDQIRIVLPQNLESLIPVPGEDLCTLVTCTPYGVNTHRLLVRGHRVPNEIVDNPSRVTADSVQLDPVFVALVIGVPMLGVMLIITMAGDRRRKHVPDEDED